LEGVGLRVHDDAQESFPQVAASHRAVHAIRINSVTRLSLLEYNS
jgi:hypothetical protein